MGALRKLLLLVEDYLARLRRHRHLLCSVRREGEDYSGRQLLSSPLLEAHCSEGVPLYSDNPSNNNSNSNPLRHLQFLGNQQPQQAARPYLANPNPPPPHPSSAPSPPSSVPPKLRLNLLRPFPSPNWAIRTHLRTPTSPRSKRASSSSRTRGIRPTQNVAFRLTFTTSPRRQIPSRCTSILRLGRTRKLGRKQCGRILIRIV